MQGTPNQRQSLGLISIYSFFSHPILSPCPLPYKQQQILFYLSIDASRTHPLRPGSIGPSIITSYEAQGWSPSTGVGPFPFPCSILQDTAFPSRVQPERCWRGWFGDLDRRRSIDISPGPSLALCCHLSCGCISFQGSTMISWFHRSSVSTAFIDDLGPWALTLSSLLIFPIQEWK